MTKTQAKKMPALLITEAGTQANLNCTSQQTGELVQVHHETMWTTSVLIADRFGKRHANVLRAIEEMTCSDQFRQLNFELADYVDEQGKPRKSYYVSRDGFSFLAMGFTGKEVSIWKERFISAFGRMERDLLRIAKQKTDPSRQLAIKEKRVAATLLTDCLVDSRADQGKETKDHHFRNEHALCNWVLTGSFDALDESVLTKLDAKRLSDIRRRDAVLLLKGLGYSNRKNQLRSEFPILPGIDRLTAANGYLLLEAE